MCGREMWILSCLDDFISLTRSECSANLFQLISADGFGREKILLKLTSKDKEILFNEVSKLEKEIVPA